MLKICTSHAPNVNELLLVLESYTLKNAPGLEGCVLFPGQLPCPWSLLWYSNENTHIIPWTHTQSQMENEQCVFTALCMTYSVKLNRVNPLCSALWVLCSQVPHTVVHTDVQAALIKLMNLRTQKQNNRLVHCRLSFGAVLVAVYNSSSFWQQDDACHLVM